MKKTAGDDRTTELLEVNGSGVKVGGEKRCPRLGVKLHRANRG